MRQSKQVSILCDTNILIYYMLCTPRFIKDVMKLFERCVEREVKLSCASLSLKDVFYITPERFKERFMNDESMVVATTAKLILPEVATSTTLPRIRLICCRICSVASSKQAVTRVIAAGFILPKIH